MVYQYPSLIVSDRIATYIIGGQFPFHLAALLNEGR
jgi:hypothetical protein